VDFGTATNLDAVSSDGAYLGGAIMPGPGIALDALLSQAALLSPVELAQTDAAIGANTPDALRCGILSGRGTAPYSYGSATAP
jgi:type III pantothenate kinase